MNEPITITLVGAPQGKGRARAFLRGGHIGHYTPEKKPDLDNICKAWNDALNGVVYRDDSLICRMALEKRYGPQSLVVVTVKPIEVAA